MDLEEGSGTRSERVAVDGDGECAVPPPCMPVDHYGIDGLGGDGMQIGSARRLAAASLSMAGAAADHADDPLAVGAQLDFSGAGQRWHGAECPVEEGMRDRASGQGHHVVGAMRRHSEPAVGARAKGEAVSPSHR